MEAQWHAKQSSQVLKEFNSGEHGLSAQDARKRIVFIVLTVIIFISPRLALASAPAGAENSGSAFPAPFIQAAAGIQGEPVQIIISDIKNIADVKSISVDGKKIPVFSYLGNVQAVYGIDINKKIGDVPIVAVLKDGKTISTTLTITQREKPTLDFTIPDSLGGTNPQGEKNVTTLLVKESAILASLWSNPKKLWTQAFRYPTENPFVTDPYGYNRDTGTQTITHKGTDFRAPPGTPVYAVNRGVVRLVKNFSIYGKTVIVDHGQGIQSFYMHLSKISVSQGTIVARGQKIGESGQTGYAEGAHLHLTVRTNGTSIDPMKFFSFYADRQLSEILSTQ